MSFRDIQLSRLEATHEIGRGHRDSDVHVDHRQHG